MSFTRYGDLTVPLITESLTYSNIDGTYIYTGPSPPPRARKKKTADDIIDGDCYTSEIGTLNGNLLLYAFFFCFFFAPDSEQRVCADGGHTSY